MSEITQQEDMRGAPGSRAWRPGPGVLVTAAFVGPGTVTTCTVAGADFGYALTWALIFATVAAVVLQTMAGRLGILARAGLGETLAGQMPGPVMRLAISALMVIAVGIGAMAYEAGNITGSAVGLSLLFGLDRIAGIAVTGLAAGFLMLTGGVRFITWVLAALVGAMILAFLAGLALVGPDWPGIVSGLRPRVPEGALPLIIALIGTTIVPYNLFLHAAAARDHWPVPSPGALRHVALDTAVTIAVGGLISAAIMVMAAAGLAEAVGGEGGSRVTGPADFARSLEPVYGTWAKTIIGVGLFAAALTSAVAAPLATAYLVQEIVPDKHLPLSRALRFRAVMLLVLAVGLIVASLDINVVRVIVTAQIANGFMLPVVAMLLLWAMNQRRILGIHTNGPIANGVGAVVIAITIMLGARSLARALGIDLFG